MDPIVKQRLDLRHVSGFGRIMNFAAESGNAPDQRN